MIDDSDRGIITQSFFHFATKNKQNYELVVSPVAIDEIEDATPKKKDRIMAFLESLTCIKLPISQEAHDLAWNYVFENILTEKHFEDLLHVAYATVFNCDIFLSWNRKHLAKLSTIQKVNLFNVANNYSAIIIATPQDFLNQKDKK
jgi:hypothetical protein